MKKRIEEITIKTKCTIQPPYLGCYADPVPEEVPIKLTIKPADQKNTVICIYLINGPPTFCGNSYRRPNPCPMLTFKPETKSGPYAPLL